MKKYFTIFITTIILIITSNSFSQLFLSFGPSLGVSVPVGDYAGETIDYYNGTKYGLKPGVNFGASAVLKTPAINFKGFFLYSILQNSGNAEYNIGKVDIKQNVSTFGIGPQYSYSLPRTKVKIYAEALFTISIFSGNSNFFDAPNIQNGTYDLNSTRRIGTQLGIGTEIKLEGYRIDLNLSYGILNLSGKQFVNYESGRENTYKNLNDDIDPLYSPNEVFHPVNSRRTISMIKFNVSVLYDIDF